jgi:hypothetical protein
VCVLITFFFNPTARISANYCSSSDPQRAEHFYGKHNMASRSVQRNWHQIFFRIFRIVRIHHSNSWFTSGIIFYFSFDQRVPPKNYPPPTCHRHKTPYSKLVRDSYLSALIHSFFHSFSHPRIAFRIMPIITAKTSAWNKDKTRGVGVCLLENWMEERAVVELTSQVQYRTTSFCRTTGKNSWFFSVRYISCSFPL